ncbi:META domain-containing protein [Marinivivus vitaminiproducens]|uniref:META domain-containing protein n=1 Tax=Marinivivus vitaminiproducens TaxID=3035935 RepID=UPI0027A201F2|nr:META domain-containing protein [Geminicoccaceae bacterium SCSIO 64248]
MARSRSRHVAIAAMLALAGCASASDNATPDGEWTVAAIGGDAVAGDPPLTLTIGQDRYGGYAGCNRYGGAVTVTGGAIAFGPAAATRMFCGGPGQMEREQALFDSLQAADSWRLEADRLVLDDGEGGTVLTLDRAP